MSEAAEAAESESSPGEHVRGSAREGAERGEAVPKNRLFRWARTFRRDLQRAWRSGGARSAWSELRVWLVYPIFRHGRLVVMEQDLASTADVPLPPGVEIGIFSGDIDAEFAEIANERTRDRFRRAIARGRICFVARRKGRLIGYAWLSDRIDPDLEVHPVPLPSGAVYGWDVYVVPEERGQRIGPALGSERLRYARDQGYRTSWRVIAPDNRASFRAAKKTSRDDIRVWGELWYVKILGRVLAWPRPARRAAPH